MLQSGQRIVRYDTVRKCGRNLNGNYVNTLSTNALAGACRIFMDLAYPDGPRSIPAFKVPYYEMTAEHSLIEFLPPAPKSVGVTKTMSRGGAFGYEFRLGSAAYLRGDKGVSTVSRFSE